MSSNVFFTTGNKPRAIASIRHGANRQPQSLHDDSIHDGDTLGTHVQGSVSVRFLGIDAPEISIDLAVVNGEVILTPRSGMPISPTHLRPSMDHSSSMLI